MKLRALILAAALSVAASGAVAGPPRPDNGPPSDTVVMYEPDDREMNAAIDAAKATLPSFWRLFATDDVVAETGGLKVAFPVRGGGNEYMWLSNITRDGKTIRGVLDNIPEMDIEPVAKGDTLTIDPARIVDWYYVRNGRMYGSYTTRVMLKHLSPREAADYRSVLSDRPVEGPDT